MKKIIAIVWKDTLMRFDGWIEWVFFIVLPIVFTLALAGGTGGSADNRVRLVVVDQAKSPLSAELITALGNSQAIRPDLLTLAQADSQFSQRSAAAVLVIPPEFDLAHLEQGSIPLELRQQPNNMDAMVAQRAVESVISRVSSAADIANQSTAKAEQIRPFASAADRQSYYTDALNQAQSLLSDRPRPDHRIPGIHARSDPLQPAHQFIRRTVDHVGIHPVDIHIEPFCVRTTERYPTAYIDLTHPEKHLPAWHNHRAGPYRAGTDDPVDPVRDIHHEVELGQPAAGIDSHDDKRRAGSSSIRHHAGHVRQD